MSKIEVDAIEPQSGTTLTLGASGDTITIPSGATITNSGTATGFGGGKVLQVIQGTTSTSKANTTVTYTDSNLTASITPSSSSNKVLVLITQKIYLATGTSDRGAIKIKLVRGATDIWEDTLVYFQTTGISGEIDRFFCMNYLDSPSTTSATTYKTQFAIDSTATNKLGEAQQSNMPSFLTLIEIAG